ncbi:pyridoxal kinase PdxY [Hoeflea prorocentri]|uniref:pyridoxal kinase n=1 Tax=Hoeflea prorocentri TaxID=1922333 RepID=A0A9X3ZIS0_9HYPH|nr:pyridoxal kinase PdxY [Hoeflea prorocentri]MCY6383202.1 pyridoxal kinase PdxY [Hoeflea prorocentri]MDA5401002.1 pyridoxal kinase PdxY [Hoeflea prorocentri]
MSVDTHHKPDQGAVLVISSHVVRGSVGNRAAVFALETLGHPVWALPTVVLPWHPGHGPATRSMLPIEDFAAIVDDLCRAPWIGEVGAVLSGYLGDARQAPAIERLVKTIRDQNPDAHYVCDPVIGDANGLYVPEETASEVRDRLIPLATMTTPNRFELEWICSTTFDDNMQIVEAARSLGPKRVVVTSALPMMSGCTGNILVTAQDALMAEHQEIARPPNGPGDLLASLMLAHVMNGKADEKSLQSASASVFEILARTVKRGADELALESEADSLKRPFALVNMRRLMRPASPRKRVIGRQ